jgi:hypothetical protein
VLGSLKKSRNLTNVYPNNKKNNKVTRLKIASVLTRVLKAISICTEGSKSQCNVLLIAGKACNKLPAYGRLLRL